MDEVVEDEHCHTQQLYQRYGDWIEQTAKTLAWEKINYDLVESMVVFIALCGKRDCPVPTSGSILVFVAVKYFKIEGDTNTLLYSTDEGLSWKEHKYYPTPIR